MIDPHGDIRARAVLIIKHDLFGAPCLPLVFAALQDEMATLLRRRIYWATRDESNPAQRLKAGLHAYFEFYDEYRNWMRRLTVEGLGIDESFEARQVQLYETLAGGFAPTLGELGVRVPAVAAAALIGMAAQVAYW